MNIVKLMNITKYFHFIVWVQLASILKPNPV